MLNIQNRKNRVKKKQVKILPLLKCNHCEYTSILNVFLSHFTLAIGAHFQA